MRFSEISIIFLIGRIMMTFIQMFSCPDIRVEAEDPSEECCWSLLLVSYVRAIVFKQRCFVQFG
jgi:hypothetical protein